MSKFKPMLIRFDEEGYNRECQRMENKSNILRKALEWMHANAANVKFTPKNESEWAELDRGFVHWFKDKYWEVNSDLVKLPISVDKALELMEVNLAPLWKLWKQYSDIDPVHCPLESEDGIYYIVPKEPYQVYTKNAEENRKLKVGRKLIELLEHADEVTHIYPLDIQKGTSELIKYNLKTGEYIVNIR